SLHRRSRLPTSELTTNAVQGNAKYCPEKERPYTGSQHEYKRHTRDDHGQQAEGPSQNHRDAADGHGALQDNHRQEAHPGDSQERPESAREEASQAAQAPDFADLPLEPSESGPLPQPKAPDRDIQGQQASGPTDRVGLGPANSEPQQQIGDSECPEHDARVPLPDPAPQPEDLGV